uniref:Jade family PHD finger 2 n=1 Tax=Vombatus ursinus TaxID=29139 RepID=A0A4X2KCX2_VOMUR
MEEKRRKYSISSDNSDTTDSHTTSNSRCSKIPTNKPSWPRQKEKKPSEVFRTDLITAMKIPDSYQLSPDEYYILADPWRQEWEKGVQVPAGTEAIPEPVVRVLPLLEHTPGQISPSSLSGSELSEVTRPYSRYDLDEIDAYWLELVNLELKEMEKPELDEMTMERVLEELETVCHQNMNMAIETEEGLGIEYDEDVVCDVCRSPEGEDGNEMVFCDKCNVCVHQACYGILKVPTGSWLCRTCALGVQPRCLLCPKRGGALKPTRSGTKWVHVSCALWIPEVSIGCPEKMEPITKISHIPASRWALSCSLCRECTGTCIQVDAQMKAFPALAAWRERGKMVWEGDEVGNRAYLAITALLGNRKGSSHSHSVRWEIFLVSPQVRNLCYMVTRREKMKHSICKLQEQIFHLQMRLIEKDLYREQPGKRSKGKKNDSKWKGRDSRKASPEKKEKMKPGNELVLGQLGLSTSFPIDGTFFNSWLAQSVQITTENMAMSEWSLNNGHHEDNTSGLLSEELLQDEETLLSIMMDHSLKSPFKHSDTTKKAQSKARPANKKKVPRDSLGSLLSDHPEDSGASGEVRKTPKRGPSNHSPSPKAHDSSVLAGSRSSPHEDKETVDATPLETNSPLQVPGSLGSPKTVVRFRLPKEGRETKKLPNPKPEAMNRPPSGERPKVTLHFDNETDGYFSDAEMSDSDSEPGSGRVQLSQKDSGNEEVVRMSVLAS